jgi:hypothetical protein
MGGGDGLENIVGCLFLPSISAAHHQAYLYFTRLAGLVKYRQGW